MAKTVLTVLDQIVKLSVVCLILSFVTCIAGQIFSSISSLVFSTSIKSSLDASNQLEMNSHYLVDLKQGKDITDLKDKGLEYYYAVNDNKQHKITFDIVNILTGKTGEKSDLALLI